MRRLLALAIGVVMIGMNGCALIFPWDDFEDRLQFMQENNPTGCAYVKGSGTPPASRVDGAVLGGWGKDVTVKDCAEILKSLP